MASYNIAHGETVVIPSHKELEHDLARSLSNHSATARVMTEDLVEVLAWVRDCTEYLRRAASNDAEAAELLKRSGASL